MNKKLTKAEDFMRLAHSGQTRWDKKTPYETHPKRVVEILQELGVTDTDTLCAGYLHDVLEDTDVNEFTLRKEFGINVCNLVKELTFRPRVTDEEYWWQCGEMSRPARWIKIADIYANLEGGKKSQHFIDKRIKALIILMEGME